MGEKSTEFQAFYHRKKAGLLFSLKLHKFQEKSAEKKPQENWPQKRHRNAFEKKSSKVEIIEHFYSYFTHSLFLQLFFKEVAKKCKGNVN